MRKPDKKEGGLIQTAFIIMNKLFIALQELW